MTIEECAKMPTCNLAETVHNKWLQQFWHKMTCLYEATLDDMVHAFMLFGSTKRKLNLPPGVDCDSHCISKVNYFIPRPNTHAIRQRIEETLSSAEQGVAHITSVLETDCLVFKWHIARLPPNLIKQCWAL